MNWHDILERASWTAVQAFVGAITAAEVGVAVTDLNIDQLEALLLSGLGGAVAALVSFVKTLAQERMAVLDTRVTKPKKEKYTY